MKQSVSVLQAYRVTQSLLARKLDVNPTMIAPIGRSATMLPVEVVKRNACHYVEAILVPKVLLVMPKTTKKFVFVIHL